MIKELDYEKFTDKFFDELLLRVPTISHCFSDKSKQRKMIIVVLMILRDLEDNEILQDDYIKLLGEQHKGNGLTKEHFRLGREAFIVALDSAGANLDADRKAEIMSIYSRLEQAMGFGLELRKTS